MSEEIVELKTSDTSYSKAECLKYQSITIINDITQKPCHGEYSNKGFTTRFKNGLLHGGKSPDGIDLPAYESDSGHAEFYENGLLHRENAPAVISNWGDWEEWWCHGQLTIIRTSGKINKKIGEENE